MVILLHPLLYSLRKGPGGQVGSRGVMPFTTKQNYIPCAGHRTGPTYSPYTELSRTGLTVMIQGHSFLWEVTVSGIMRKKKVHINM
jgi:hypothetical protein